MQYQSRTTNIKKTARQHKYAAKEGTAHEEKKFYAAKIKFYAARQIGGNNRTVGANLERQMNSQSGEKYYATTVILPQDKQEKRNAALRVKKRWIPQRN